MDYRPSRTAVLVSLTAASIALCVALLAPNLSRIHRFDNADSLIPIFVSLDRWTPFYWGQARFGMLVPLLASVIRNPLLNLLFQTEANVVSSLISFVLLDRVVNSRPVDGWMRFARVCLALSLWYIVVTDGPRLYHLVFLPGLPYSASLALLLAALVSAGFASALVKIGSPRFAGFAGLLFLALYVNEANFPVALLLVFALPTDSKYQAVRRVAAAGVVIAAELLVRFISSYYGAPLSFRFAPLAYLPDAVTATLDQLFDLLVSPSAAVVLGLLVVASVALAFIFKRAGVKRQVLTLVAAGITSVGVALVTTALEWTEHNLYDIRYWTTPVLLMLMCGTLFVASWLGNLPRTPLVAASCALLLAGTSVYKFGMPSWKRMETSVLQATTYHQPGLAALGL